jgi:xanthosine utilization system XapX-like protein
LGSGLLTGLFVSLLTGQFPADPKIFQTRIIKKLFKEFDFVRKLHTLIIGEH